MYGACKKNHAVGENRSAKLDGCVSFVGRRIGDNQCLMCGCHVGFHIQPKASDELKALWVNPADVAFGACKNNLAGPKHEVHDGCQRYFPRQNCRDQQEEEELCDVCGCEKVHHETFHPTSPLESRIISSVQSSHS
ncbi:hypothetical protein R1flu_012824 [Riccia fluitans]|uniref:ZF-HD dimerization-type domain-containing protein n=1 Tax=Riccia fluitans TaxID=41844 RepID=A0ABD1ZBP5_9MARC